ncbi:MAG: SIR2 family protein [Candidatus Omnitrophota bacterium]
MSENLFTKLEGLSERILSGEVVFFIGAGFSIESEDNSSKRLIRRLLIRFLAITDVLCEMNSIEKNTKETSEKLKKILLNRYELKELSDLKELTSNDIIKNNAIIEKLARDYYQINDWMCSAYNMLINEMIKLKVKKKEICKAIYRKEKELLNDNDNVAIDPIKLHKYKKLNFHLCHPGKAMFLDTMGFDNSDIMAGKPNEEIDEVLKSYQGRLRKRHHILARLAREGLSNPLITTNYDLLLEGGYRLAGFTPRHEVNGNQQIMNPPPHLYPYFQSIGDANHFFNYGGAHRTALITKIHGCVDKYRKNKKSFEDWGKYLPAMVFTYREIQNWREDSWSRDYIRTLLRTRTIVFCGYSGADPVLHDTFRSVYEEMEGKRSKCVPPKDKPKSEKKNIPAFFFGAADKKEFHGIEILRAASKAVKEKAYDVTDHDNYLEFHIKENKFPNLDESLIWLFHLTSRRLQYQCIKNNLHQIGAQLLEHPCPLSELEIIKKEFERLFEKEKECAKKSWDDSANSRNSFNQITDWTEYFHSGFLKQYATADYKLGMQGIRNDKPEKRSPFWYFPFTGNPGWTAWTVVLEIALRKIINKLADSGKEWHNISNSDIRIIPAATPTLAITQSNKYKTPIYTPILLVFKFQDFDPIKPSLKIPGVFRKQITWNLNPEAIPWEKEDYSNGPIAELKIPGAKTIWSWAANEDPDKYKDLAKYFGEKINNKENIQ